MTTERLAEIQARAEAATEGPWGTNTPARQIFAADEQGEKRPRTGMRPAGDTFPLIGQIMLPPDAEFCAHARTDIPFLLALIARLQGAMPTDEQRERWAERCTTHSRGCDCREAHFRRLEAENERLKAITCREMCECGKDWQTDAEAINISNHDPQCVWVECMKEATTP